MCRLTTPANRSLDLWRGICCVAVVILHSTAVFRFQSPHSEPTVFWLTQFGCLGVPFFFVISGYCLSAAADSVRIKNQGVRHYFIRRIRRIYPPYWIAILLGAAAFFIAESIFRIRIFSGEPAPQPSPQSFLPSQWFGNFSLTETWRPYAFGDDRRLFIPQAWTLCYEEQFYFVVGILLLCARRHFFQGMIAITALVLAVRIAVPGVAESGLFIDGQWFAFAAGAAVYYVLNYRTRPGAMITCAFLIAIGVLGLMLSCWIPIRITVAMFLAALLLILYPIDNWIFNKKCLYPFSICGRMCYSLYLVHELVVASVSRVAFNAGLRSALTTLLIVVPLCVVASLGCGWLFYVCVERRFLNASQATSIAMERIVMDIKPKNHSPLGVSDTREKL